MKRNVTLLIMFAAFFSVAAVAKETKEIETVLVRLADVTVTAQPANRHVQTYIFTLKNKDNALSWTLELPEHGLGRMLLLLAGDLRELNEKRTLQSQYSKGTTLRLQKTKPKTVRLWHMGERRPDETRTHKLLSLTWGQQDLNKAIDSDKE